MTSSVVNKTVVLLTTSFPYGTGEQFIETEINYLADMASRVFIVPMKIEGISRPTPTNVTVIKELAQRNSRTGPIGKLLHALWLVLLSPLDLRFNLRYLSSLLIAAYYRNLTWQFFNDLLSKGLVRCEGTIFYSYWFSPEVAGIVKIKGQRRDLVVVTRAHGSDLYASAKQLPEFPFRKAIISQLDAVFCISSHGQAYLEERYGAKNIVLSRLGSPGPAEISLLKAGDSILLVSCSSVVPNKRVDLILESVAVLSGGCPSRQFVWVHIGGGPLLQKTVTRARERVASVPNLCCHFLGHVGNSEVFNFYRRNYVDCFVNLSASEGLPVSFMEAMSFGVPVVATNVGGVSEIVTRDSGILLSEQPTPTEAARAIEIVTFKTSDCNFRRGARAVWEARFDARKNYLEFCGALERLFKGNDNPQA